MKKSLLVTLADGNYIEQAKQLFSGAWGSTGWKGDYMLLAYNIAEKDLTWFKDRGILVKKCGAIMTESETRIGHAPLTTLSKFYLFTPEFKKWKNIVFLDGDIITRGSLDTLAQVKGFAAARILNIFRTTLKGQFNKRTKKNQKLFDELADRYDLKRPAFNSGVMAFNTDIISEGDFQNLKTILFRFRDIIAISEETVLNIYFYDRWRELSQVYNVCPGYELYLSGCLPSNLKAIISHTYSNFPGGKPWLLTSPLYSEWKSNLDRADMIDITKPKVPKKMLSAQEEEQDDYYLKNLQKRYFYKFYGYKIRYFCAYNNFRLSTGAYLRKKYPRINKLQRRLRNLE
ncbi:MAG: glycosyltransferase [Smithella sp.]|nr:glycosyltransferase [Smithella sp.]